MQYLLSQEEFDKLRAEAKQKSCMPSKSELQEFCTMIADTVPVKSGWFKGKVWGCIITKEKLNPGDENWEPEWYCDDCPAKSVCPYEYKEHSK